MAKYFLNLLATRSERKSIVTEFKGLRIFTSNKNKIDLNLEKSFSRDSFEFYENVLRIEFFPVVIRKKLMYIYYKNGNIIFFSKKMNLLFEINIKKIKKISTSGRFSLLIKLFYNDKNSDNDSLQNFMIKFFSSSQREYLLEKILPYSSKSSYDNFKKLTIIDICKDSFSFFNHISLVFSNRLKKTGHFYYSDIYKIFDFKINYDFKVFLILSEIGIIQKSFEDMYYNVENIWYDKQYLVEIYEEMLFSGKRHRDSITPKKLGKNNQLGASKFQGRYELDENSLNEEEMNLFRQYSKNMDNNAIDSLNENRDLYNMRRRHLMAIKKSKSICDKNFLRFNSFRSNEDFVLSKPVYDKITFNVMILRYLGKEQKVLEVNSGGFFLIYKKGKVS